ncbi:MAG: choice-of-anchor E domain-containing protein [Akkermansiaceae bacterium]|nr:choice-of-anchor E domain-containing protein [Akkermansiaceae bacterium]
MKAFLAVSCCLAILSGAHAQTLTMTSEYGLPIMESVTEIDETGHLALFDSDLGILTAITLELYGAGTTELSITNSAVTAVNARITGTSTLSFTSSLAPLDTLLQNSGADIDLQFSTGGIQSFAVGETRNFGPLSTSSSNVYDLASIIYAMQAPGGGNFSINAQSLNGLTILGGGGNLSSQQTTTAGTGARIIYSYTAIPEPSSALLAGLAALPLIGRRRRK